MASVVVLYFSPKLLAKDALWTDCGPGLVKMNDNGEGVPPVPFRDGRTALALHGSWLREHTYLSFPCRLKPQQAVLQDALFFFSQQTFNLV